jgi:hypothetical protein
VINKPEKPAVGQVQSKPLKRKNQQISQKAPSMIMPSKPPPVKIQKGKGNPMMMMDIAEFHTAKQTLDNLIAFYADIE